MEDDVKATILPHKPFWDGTKPFSIGLKPLDPIDWIEPDDALAADLAQKRALLETHFDTVYRETADSIQAQGELLQLLAAYLPERHPRLWRRDGSVITMVGASLDLADERLPLLVRAGLLVSDDLLLLIRRDDGWRLAAGHLSFPSSWSLAEKFDRPMDEIHANVPDFSAGTRNAMLIQRMFDNLKVDRPVWRLNWSLDPDAALHRPRAKNERQPWPDAIPPAAVYVRVERQTLRKLPVTGALVFSIRIYKTPLGTLTRHADARAGFGTFADHLEMLDADKTAYKGIGAIRPRLVSWLREQAAS